MEKLVKMYKQRLVVQLVTILLITLTLISLIEIYLFSLGIFSYILTGIVLIGTGSKLFHRFSLKRNELIRKQTAEEERQKRDDNIRHNSQVYHNFIETIGNTSRMLPELQYKNNTKLSYVNNEDRMKFLKRLEDNLQTMYKVNFQSLYQLVGPHIELIKMIQKIDQSLQKTAKIHPLKDLLIDEKISENLQALRQYHHSLMEKGDKYINDYQSTSLGLEGEERVSKELALYDDILVNIPSVRFEVNGLSVETDNFVISPFGIFAIEVKNIGSSGKFKIKIEKDGRWVKVFKNSTKVMNNITSQTYRHIGLKQKLINQELKKLNYPEYDMLPLR